MSTPPSQVEALVLVLDHTLEETAADFGYDHWHSLMWNLHNTRPEDWDVSPAGGGRSIGELVRHLGLGYLSYENHAFGDRQRLWGDRQIGDLPLPETPAEWMAWLRAAHRVFRDKVATLTDDRLEQISYAPWGAELPMRRIIELQIQTTLYHCGAINHIRALLQSNDDWDHEDLGRDAVPAA